MNKLEVGKVLFNDGDCLLIRFQNDTYATLRRNLNTPRIMFADEFIEAAPTGATVKAARAGAGMVLRSVENADDRA